MIKSKPCTVEDCNNPRWAKGLCKRHQSLRTDGKAPKGIKKITDKGIKKKKLKASLWPTDMAFYLEIWMERPHVCFNCNKDLGDKPLTLYFDHILEKGSRKYAHLRHVKENICLLCWDCHSSKTMHPKLKELRNKTIELLCDTHSEIQKEDLQKNTSLIPVPQIL